MDHNLCFPPDSFDFKHVFSISLFCPFPFPPLLSSITCSSHKQHTQKHFHTSSPDQDCQKQTAVVLLSSTGKTCHGSGVTSVTTLCADALPASKHTKQRDWLSLLRPSSVNLRPNSSLRFSVSLNDVGQRVDSLCRGLHFIDRTCSEGELEMKPAQPPSSDRKAHTLDGKLSAAPAPPQPNPTLSTGPRPHLVPSFTNNYKYTLGIPPADCFSSDSTVAAPPLFNAHLHPHHCPSAHFLRRILPFLSLIHI